MVMLGIQVPMGRNR